MATLINSGVSSDVWVDISTLHSLTATQKYYLQNIGHTNLTIVEASSTPSFDQLGHIVKPDEPFYFTQDASLKIYVISRDAYTGQYAITESA